MKLEKTGIFRWRLPVGSIPGMHVPGIVYANDAMIETIRNDGSLSQLANAATLPGVETAVIAMPDMHFGYGLPIGGVMASNTENGILSPGGVGYDINCGVRMIRTPLEVEHVKPHVEKLVDQLYRSIPCGVGSEGKIRLNAADIRKVMNSGAKWAVEAGFGIPDDAVFCESSGCMDGADSTVVSDRAIERGRDQLGTLGSGNHFIELQFVRKIYDREAAAVMGITENQVTLMVHSGSRGLGHQICTDYLQTMVRGLSKHRIIVPDRQLACAPFQSDDGRRYLGAMKAAANYAWANRQCLMHWIRTVLIEYFGRDVTEESLGLVYDVAHNIIKIEKHEVSGKILRLAVHRKGATRAFGANHPELPLRYCSVGQPVIIPGDMGTASYLLVGTDAAMKETFGSACHGAGRRLSRKAAMRQARGRSISDEMKKKGIYVRAEGCNTLKEEMPEAYKNITEVIEVITGSGIARLVAQMHPIGVLKG